MPKAKAQGNARKIKGEEGAEPRTSLAHSVSTKPAQSTDRADIVDGRTWIGRRRRDLTQAYVSDHGGSTDATTAQKALIDRIVAIQVRCELHEAAYFSGEVRMTQKAEELYSREVGLLSRLLSTLGMKRIARDADAAPSWEELTHDDDDDTHDT